MPDPTTMAFPTRNDHFGVVLGGYHHFRKPPHLLYQKRSTIHVGEYFQSSHDQSKMDPSWYMKIYNLHLPVVPNCSLRVFHHPLGPWGLL